MCKYSNIPIGDTVQVNLCYGVYPCMYCKKFIVQPRQVTGKFLGHEYSINNIWCEKIELQEIQYCPHCDAPHPYYWLTCPDGEELDYVAIERELNSAIT